MPVPGCSQPHHLSHPEAGNSTSAARWRKNGRTRVAQPCKLSHTQHKKGMSTGYTRMNPENAKESEKAHRLWFTDTKRPAQVNAPRQEADAGLPGTRRGRPGSNCSPLGVRRMSRDQRRGACTTCECTKCHGTVYCVMVKIDFTFYFTTNPKRLRLFIAKNMIHHNLRSAYQQCMHVSNYARVGKAGGEGKAGGGGLEKPGCQVLGHQVTAQ